MKDKKTLTLKTLTKSNVWDLQENDIFRMWEVAERDADLRDNMRHYTDIIRSAFEMEELKIDKPQIIKKYEDRGYKIGLLRLDEQTRTKLSWQEVYYRILKLLNTISATKLLEVLDRNFGGGWDSLSQSIHDIIESGFDISTTTLPADRLRKPGGMYEKKVNDGFEVLEIPKGSWVEAIFAKAKPEVEKPRMRFEMPDDDLSDEQNEDEDLPEEDDRYEDEDEDEDEYDEDRLTEESYRTTFEAEPEDLNLEAEEMSDEYDA